MKHKSIITLDFDGVVHSYTSGWKGPRTIPDDPVPGAIGYMLHMLAEGWDVCIHSSRSGAWFGRRAMRSWLRKHAHGCWYESPVGPGLEDVRFPLHKPPAIITIDDRALTFDGDWQNPAYKPIGIRAFKPWNKR
jgi:hypothetical protein